MKFDIFVEMKPVRGDINMFLEKHRKKEENENGIERSPPPTLLLGN
jgi:hypothetical protein